MPKFAMTLLLLWLVAGPVLAQNATPIGAAAPPDPQFVQNALAVLQQQRNRAQDEAAQAQAQLALVQSKLEAAQKELAALKEATKTKDKPTVAPAK